MSGAELHAVFAVRHYVRKHKGFKKPPLEGTLSSAKKYKEKFTVCILKHKFPRDNLYISDDLCIPRLKYTCSNFLYKTDKKCILINT